MNLSLRQTGRTTRTRERAMEMADHGFAVYVLMPTIQMARLEQKAVDEAWERRYKFDRASSGIKVEAFDAGWAVNWDWKLMQPKSSFNSNCRFLMDHTVVEAEIRRQQEIAQQAINRATLLYPYTV